MNCVAIGALGEVLGGIAVVASLVYLAAQVRQNTRAMNAATADSVVRSIREFLQPIIADQEVAWIFRTGIEGMDDLDEDQQARFLHMLFSWLKTVENAHYQYLQNTMTSDVWAGWRGLCVAYVTSPGVQAYWKMRRDAFSPAFQEFVDSIDETTVMPRVAQMVGSPGTAADR